MRSLKARRIRRARRPGAPFCGNREQRAAGSSAPTGQVSLGDIGGETVLKKLRMTDVNILSPIEALNLLAELKEDLNGG